VDARSDRAGAVLAALRAGAVFGSSLCFAAKAGTAADFGAGVGSLGCHSGVGKTGGRVGAGAARSGIAGAAATGAGKTTAAGAGSRRYKSTTKSAAEIGRELAADYLVESSLRAEDTRLRVTSTLVRVRDQVQVWSQSYDREPMSLLGLQLELSTAITEQIRLRLSPGRLETLARRQTQSPDAYDLYLRAMPMHLSQTEAANAEGAIASSQGNPSATPAPRRTVRRDRGFWRGIIIAFSPVAVLFAGPAEARRTPPDIGTAHS